MSGPRPHLGSWTIETGRPGDGSVGAFDQLARHAILAAVVAFAGLARIDRAALDLAWLGSSHDIIRVEESVLVQPDASGVLPETDADLVTAAFLRTSPVFPDGSGVIEIVYACVLEGESDRIEVTDSAVTVTVGDGPWLDPEAVDKVRRLTAALHHWEDRTGSPIVEWFSPTHPDRIARHGFT